jgi:hypothetical protein
MLDGLRAASVLRGDRGGASVDFDRVAQVLVRLTQAASMVGPSFAALEVNPLWCSGGQVEALDVLVETKDAGG